MHKAEQVFTIVFMIKDRSVTLIMYCLLPTASLSLTRGDTISLRLPLYEGTGIDRTPYSIKESDILYVGLMECNQAFEDALVRKKLTVRDVTDNQFLVRFTTEDTEDLKTGKYFISAKLANGLSVTTVLPLTEFWITGTDRNGGVC